MARQSIINKYKKNIAEQQIADEALVKPDTMPHSKERASLQSTKSALETFLNSDNVPPQQNIFITIGCGTRNDQLWPRPYYDVRKQNQSVFNMVIEQTPAIDYVPNRNNTLSKKEKEQLLQDTITRRFAVDFPFKLPRIFECPRYDVFTSPWRTQDQLDLFKQRWQCFLTQCLNQGKILFLGYHIDATPDGYFLEVYNELKAQFPEQIFLLLGHEEYAAVPVYTVTNEQLRIARTSKSARIDEPIRSLFRFYNKPHEVFDERSLGAEDALLDPEITVAHLKEWGKTAATNSASHFESRKNLNILDKLLLNYIQKRSNVLNSKGTTKEYFHCSWFSYFQKSYTKKTKAVNALRTAIAGEHIDLNEHLSTLRNGRLGGELREFIRSGKANELVGEKVNTISGFVRALQALNSKNKATPNP